MKPRGPLMAEHRLIERMLELIRKEFHRLEEEKRADTLFIDSVVDFFTAYTDGTHHGKEEDILFAELGKKDMSQRDREMMQELFEEHGYARKTIGVLDNARRGYLHGEKESLDVIADTFNALLTLYQAHIHKEDTVFLPASEGYLTEEEQNDMIKNSGNSTEE